jgi:hypothetical protein
MRGCRSRFTEEHRDALNESGQITTLLGLNAGMTIGDIGAGSGYHTVRLSPIVGPSGWVIAQDVTLDYLVELARRTARLKLTNVKFALGEPHDPRLPASFLDVTGGQAADNRGGTSQAYASRSRLGIQSAAVPAPQGISPAKGEGALPAS